MNRKFLSVLILLVAVGLAYFVYSSEAPGHWWARPFRLGLDLSGGSHLVYDADTTQIAPGDIKDAMASLREVIERRINAFGVAEPVIQVEQVGLGTSAKHRLVVELPGVTDVQQAIAVIKVTPALEFKTERPDGAEKAAILAVREKIINQSSTTPLKLSTAEQQLALQDPDFMPTGLTGRFLKRAQVQFDQRAINPSISIEFNTDGAKLFADLTKANVGKRIGIYLDGQLLSAPVVREAIRDGRAEISGQFNVDEAQTLARNLNLGALPVPINLVSTETVGATLGSEALRKGITAGLFAFIVVALFMILWYRLPGVLAVVSLSIYVVLILTIFKLLPVTLTAAGIAGFILSVGMAVDANILIFARIKEELRHSDNLADVISHGFSRAWLSIRDSNLSSIISSLVLFWFGSSLIKGFALTLAIGVLVSMFTAITVTRTFLRTLGMTHSNRWTRWLLGSGFTN